MKTASGKYKQICFPDTVFLPISCIHRSALLYEKKKRTLPPSGSLFLIYFLFSCFSNPAIKVIQNDGVVYRCPSGVEKHNDSGYRYRTVNKSTFYILCYRHGIYQACRKGENGGRSSANLTHYQTQFLAISIKL